MSWLAFDIGGANIKVADGKGYTAAAVFPLWKNSRLLAQELRTLITESPPCSHLAITMTGELADCFATKAEGVKFILQAVKDGSDNRHTRVYLTDGRFVTPQVAEREPMSAAASNWHALARFAGRFAPRGPALLLDVGSTTCDIIPLADGKPTPRAKTDTTRLIAGELLYTGVERSPCCAILDQVTYRGQTCPVVQEFFATMRDVYIVLDEIPEGADSHTADGQPASFDASHRRLGRMIAADDTEFSPRDTIDLAQAFADAQKRMLTEAILKVTRAMPEQPDKIIVSGHGEFLARTALYATKHNASIVSLASELGEKETRCATAHGLAVLAQEVNS